MQSLTWQIEFVSTCKHLEGPWEPCLGTLSGNLVWGKSGESLGVGVKCPAYKSPIQVVTVPTRRDLSFQSWCSCRVAPLLCTAARRTVWSIFSQAQLNPVCTFHSFARADSALKEKDLIMLFSILLLIFGCKLCVLYEFRMGNYFRPMAKPAMSVTRDLTEQQLLINRTFIITDARTSLICHIKLPDLKDNCRQSELVLQL